VLWKLLSAFATFEANAARTLAGLLANGELEAARRKAHDLKGSAANLGAMAISQASARLDAALQAGQPTGAALAELARQLDTGLSAIRQALAGRD
jgi:HPt (histidine-containing phosphotransfer) domain-containing protein